MHIGAPRDVSSDDGPLAADDRHRLGNLVRREVGIAEAQPFAADERYSLVVSGW